MKIINVVGARTNPIKIAPLIIEMRHRKTIEPILAHISQHDDVKMARKFLEDFGIPEPNVSLEVGSGSHAFQTTEVMKRIEPVMGQQRSDFVLVGGDFNSTFAGAVTAAKLQISVAPVAAGLRALMDYAGRNQSTGD